MAFRFLVRSCSPMHCSWFAIDPPYFAVSSASRYMCTLYGCYHLCVPSSFELLFSSFGMVLWSIHCHFLVRFDSSFQIFCTLCKRHPGSFHYSLTMETPSPIFVVFMLGSTNGRSTRSDAMLLIRARVQAFILLTITDSWSRLWRPCSCNVSTNIHWFCW